MEVIATRDGAGWRLNAGGASIGGFALVSEDPAVFRRVVGGVRQEVRTFDPLTAGQPMRLRDMHPANIIPRPSPAPAPTRKRRT